MGVKREVERITDELYKAYGSDTGHLLGLEPKYRDTVQVIVKFALDRVTKEKSIVNMPCHTNMESDCCGIFTVVREGSIFCNECGMNINDAIELLNSRGK